jgi:hypothetical protein
VVIATEVTSVSFEKLPGVKKMATVFPAQQKRYQPSDPFSKIWLTNPTCGSSTLERDVFPHIRRYVSNPWLDLKRGLIRGIQVDMRRLTSIGVSEAAWLALAIDFLQRKVGAQIGLMLPTDERLNAFLSRWNFLNVPAFDTGSVQIDDGALRRYYASSTYYARSGQPSPRLLELTPVWMRPAGGGGTVSFQSLLTRIESVLQTQLDWSGSKALISVFCNVFLLELLNNVMEHSEAAYGLVAIQTHEGEAILSDRLEWEKAFVSENPDHVELFIGDAGTGIVNTLLQVFRRAGKEGDTTALLEFACQAGTTSKRNGQPSVQNNRGMGLYYVSQRVAEWEGACEVRSGNGIICHAYLRDGGWRTFVKPLGPHRDATDFPGTQIKILLPMHVSARSLDRLSSYL